LTVGVILLSLVVVQAFLFGLLRNSVKACLTGVLRIARRHGLRKAVTRRCRRFRRHCMSGNEIGNNNADADGADDDYVFTDTEGDEAAPVSPLPAGSTYGSASTSATTAVNKTNTMASASKPTGLHRSPAVASLSTPHSLSPPAPMNRNNADWRQPLPPLRECVSDSDEPHSLSAARRQDRVHINNGS
jgi:hypothetical protein